MLVGGPPEERFPRRLLVGLAVAAAILTLWQHLAWRGGGRALPERVVIRVVGPVQGWFSALATRVSDVAFSLAAAGSLAEQVRQLRDEVQRLKADKVRAAEAMAEAREVARLAKMPLPGELELVAVARVIGARPGFYRRWVTILAAPGIELQRDDILLSGGALAGRVVEAQGNRAEAILLVDADHAVAGVDVRSRDQGMVYARAGANELWMEKIVGRCDLRVGDVIVSSGLGQVYPKGIPIGRVVQVTGTPGSTRAVRAVIEPFVDFDRLELVQVVRVR